MLKLRTAFKKVNNDIFLLLMYFSNASTIIPLRKYTKIAILGAQNGSSSKSVAY